MWTSALVAFIHFAAAFVLVASLVCERAVFGRRMTVQDVKRLALADRWYGVSAALLLAIGFVRAVWFEKGWAYYGHNGFFHLKLTAFVVIGLLSIYPTVRIIQWNRAASLGTPPALTDGQWLTMSRILNAELALLVVLVLSASLMAHGVGAR